jgi:hypothetical protein
MPSTNLKQHNLMAMVANNPAAAKRVGIPQSVGQEFMHADKGHKFAPRVTQMTINKPKTDHGESALFSKGGEMKESKAHKSMHGMKHGVAAHEHHMTHEHHMKMAHHHLKEAMKKGGHVKRYAAGGNVTGEHGTDEKHGITTVKMGPVKAGGLKKFGEHSAQERGHTKGKHVTMAGGKGMKHGGKC